MKGQLMKKTLAALVLGLAAMKVYAVNPDTIVVSVTPGNVTYSVSIASPMAAGYQFGSVNLAATTISTVAIVITNNGNISEYFALKVANTAPDNWAPVAGVPASDQFRLMAHLTTGAQPLDATFADALDGNIPGAAAVLYGQSAKTIPTGTKSLWLRLTMPSALTGSGGAQTMKVFVNGQSS